MNSPKSQVPSPESALTLGPLELASRDGGALFPVLVLSMILLALSAMVPHVLVSASNAMRVDNTREELLYAAESGVAMGEARIKKRLADALGIGMTPDLSAFELHPTYDNPDYGKRKRYDFETRVLDLKQKDILVVDDTTERHRYQYRLETKAWSDKGQKLNLAVAGLITLTVKIDTGHGGVATRSVEDVTIQAMNREVK